MPNPAKIHPTLAHHLQIRPLGIAAESLRVIVLHRAGALGIAASIGALATHHTYRLIPASAVSVDPGTVGAMSDRADVEMIWLDETVHTLLDVSVPLIDTPKVWANEITGRGIKVGIVDTGIAPGHPDFANPTGTFSRIAQMKDFTGQGSADNQGHGTHVAGIIGGTGAAMSGKYKGVAPDCLFYTAKVLRSDGSGSMSDVMAGVEWAVQQGVQVINLSLGSDGACDGTDALSATCDAAVAHGVVVCVAAGNAGPNPSTVGSPGCAKQVITVGATTKTDQIASFSSRGPTSDNRVKPDVCFPGSNIVSCRAPGTAMGSPLNDYYTSASGTSMATPHASGACALLLQAIPNLSPAQIKSILKSTAKNLNVDANSQGTGRAQLFDAYETAVGVPPPPPPPPTPGPGGGCGQSFQSVLELAKNILGGR